VQVSGKEKLDVYWLVARYVVVNFNVIIQINPKKYVFDIVTDKLNFVAMRMLVSHQEGVNTTFYPSFKNMNIP
jgi:hypothetical protein